MKKLHCLGCSHAPHESLRCVELTLLNGKCRCDYPIGQTYVEPWAKRMGRLLDEAAQ